MAQISLYLTEQELEALRGRAEQEGLSVSKYTARLVAQDALGGGWPQGFWDLYRAIDDPAFEPVPDPVAGDEPSALDGRGR